MTQTIRALNARAFHFLILLLASVIASACHSDRQGVPEVQIRLAPGANPGGPEKLDYIEGTVKNAKAGQYIVLYAHSGLW